MKTEKKTTNRASSTEKWRWYFKNWGTVKTEKADDRKRMVAGRDGGASLMENFNESEKLPFVCHLTNGFQF